MEYLDFEKPVLEMESKIEGIRRLKDTNGLSVSDEVISLEKKINKQLEQIYKKLTPWQKTQVARHPSRPHTVHYINGLIKEFTPLAGDRLFGQDEAIITGIGRFNGQSVVVMGIEKGEDTDSRLKHNFGMAKPEGYRKVIRLMEFADHFNLPILSFVDTAGAYPGIDGEARGQAEAIARSMEKSFQISVPFIATVIGEGGSGGAIAMAVADKVLMLEHAIYSVISPEGCASILWRDGTLAKNAAESLHLTAQDLFKLKVIDEIIEEPLGGAHRHQAETVQKVGVALQKYLTELMQLPKELLKTQRQNKFIQMTRK